MTSFIPNWGLLDAECGDNEDESAFYSKADTNSDSVLENHCKNATEMVLTDKYEYASHSKDDSMEIIANSPTPTEALLRDQDVTIRQQTADDQPSLVVCHGPAAPPSFKSDMVLGGAAIYYGKAEANEATEDDATFGNVPADEDSSFNVHDEMFQSSIEDPVVPDEQLPLPVFDVLLEDMEKEEGAKSPTKKPQVDLDVNELPCADYVYYGDDREIVDFASRSGWYIKFQRRSPNNVPYFAGVIHKDYANRLLIRNNRYRSNLEWDTICTLGSGGEGEVFKGMDKSTNFYFAVKEMRKNIGVDSIRSWLCVKSDYVPRLIGITLQETVVYIFQEYVEQRNLHEVLRSRSSLALKPLPIAINLIEQTINIHKHGVIFRDIQSKNILLNPYSSEVWIVDFGLSRPDEELRRGAREPVGVWLYMSPRIMKGVARQSSSSDGYAIGVALYELISGGTRLFTSGERDKVIASLPANGPPYDRLENLSVFPLCAVNEAEIMKKLIRRLWREEEPLSAHLKWLKDEAGQGS